MIAGAVFMMGPRTPDIPDELRNWRRLPWLLTECFRVVWRAAPRELAIIIGLQVIQGAGLAAQLLIVRNVLQVLISGASGHVDVPNAVVQLGLLVGIGAVESLTSTFQQQQQSVLTELVQRHASRPITEMATAISLKDFDSPEFHDRLLRAQQTATMRPWQVTQGVLNMGRSGLGLAGLGIGLLLISPVLLLLSLVAIVPLWFASMNISRAVFEFTFEMTENDRKRSYLLSLLTNRQMAAEMRAFGVASYFRDGYEKLSDERLARLRQHLRRRAMLSTAGSLGTSLVTGVTFAVLAWLIISGHLGLAAAGAAATATIQLGGQLQGIVYSAGQLYESSLFIDDLDRFLQVLPGIRAARPAARAPHGFETLAVKNVDFTYPAGGPGRRMPMPRRHIGPALMAAISAFGGGSPDGAGRPHALRGASMKIRRGEIVALVGENGSGKTTLAKLISGLYTPDSGTIEWDGLDMSGVDPDSVRDQVAVIFQDFVRYMLTARENIGIGRIERVADAGAVRAAARHAGADSFIEHWPEQYEALLGPIFENGRDLSVGQWQRIALARAFFRDAPLIILDEPTASLDARAEAELFERMRSLFAGRSVLLISHRFSSVRSADRIYVMKEGRIVESGTHAELMELDGLYAELFNLQARAYLES